MAKMNYISLLDSIISFIEKYRKIMRLKSKASNRRIIDIRASEDISPHESSQAPIWKFDP